MVTLLHSHVFQRAGAEDSAARGFLTNLVRLTDKAVGDYELARKEFLQVVHRSSASIWGPLFRATGHMENCLNTLERIFRLARRLREHPETSALVEGIDALSPSVRKRISKLRNAMEHIDERLANKKIEDGALMMLLMGEDGIQLQNVFVAYSDLSSWIPEVHDLAENAARFGAKR